jgi:NAD(P)-dependent dehydrogenase (short-subunit alcohol dehydrogenase family)
LGVRDHVRRAIVYLDGLSLDWLAAERRYSLTMQRSLHISTTLSLPQDTVTSTLIVYGGKGMGKTNFGSVLVEELTACGLRWSVLDPLGVWWGLRHSADGKGSGIECLVLGGSHADIPIEPTAGAVVADLVVDETANVIIDFSRKPSGEMWSIGDKVRFVTDYAYRLFQRQGELVSGRQREPIFQLLDEAARYIPQVIPHGAVDLAKCVGAWEQLVEEGRNIGIGVGLLTQRSARMNKSVSEVADAIMAFRIVGPNSIGAITDWLGEHVPKAQVNSMVETIRSLERGRCLVVSPGWLKFEGVIGIRARNTFDSSATPKPGERAKRVHGEGAKPDLEKYAERMKATVEKARADDPRELRKTIDQLKRELLTKRAMPVTGPAKTVEVEVKVPVPVADPEAIKLALYERDQQWIAAVGEFRLKASKTLDTMVFVAPKQSKIAAPKLRQYRQVMYGYDVKMDKASGTGTISGPNVKPVPAYTPTTTASSNGNGEHLSLGERATLIAAAQFGGVERDQLSVLTGYKRSSRDSYVARLLAKGYIDVQGRTITPTQSGIDALGGDYQPLPTGSALYDYWKQRLPQGERVTLEYLVEKAHGEPVERFMLDDQVGYKRSSRDTYLSRLAARRLVAGAGTGSVQASKELFD